MKTLLLLLNLTLLPNVIAGTFTVTNTSDDSLTVGSLRWAIGQANANAGPDTILFDASLTGQTIDVPDSSLPAITDDFTVIHGDIDGDGVPDIALQQTFAGSPLIGLELRSSNNRVEYLIIRDFTFAASGIYINGSSDNVIVGCVLENNIHGVHVVGGGRRNRIGDGTIAGRNYIINGNNEGIRIEGSGSDSNDVLGNFIGVTSTNTASGNGTGITIAGGAKYNRIGDGTSNGRNIIAAGGATGIDIVDAGTNYNQIAGNYIGTDSTGAGQSGFEHSQKGISINDGTGNIIGGTNVGDKNIVANNLGEGIDIYQADSTEVLGNYVGLDASGNAAGNDSGGITIVNSDFVKIGDNTAAGRNVIGSNTFNGIWIQANGGRAFGNTIEGNYIGVGPDGSTPQGNSQHGIRIYANTDSASTNTVADNVIAYNTNYGIEIEGDGVPASRNFLFRNSIFNNDSGGISHIAMAQEFIGQVTGVSADIGTKIVTGTASAQNNLVQIYADQGDQGRTFLDTVYAGVGGAFSKVIPGVAPNLNITALQSDALGNTSTFSTSFATPVNKLIVTSVLDDGSLGTLRAAIDSANANTGPDTITFANPLMLGKTIGITGSSLLLFGNYNVIDGDVDGDFKPSVSIVYADSAIQGISVSGSYNLVRYLNVQKFVAGISINGSKYNRVEGCYIGTSLDGMSASGTGNTWGIQLSSSGVRGNIIGDSTNANARNIISGNTNEGIVFQNGADSNYVVGNYIGLNAAGNSALPNGNGMTLDIGSTTNFIGSSGPNGRNVISGNSGRGVYLFGNTNIVVTNNIIGLDASGTFAIGNGSDGISVNSSSSGCRIGGTLSGERNIISGNGDEGIELAGTGHIVLGNYIGTDVTGTTAIANQSGIGVFGKYNQVGDGTTAGTNVISGNTLNGVYFQSADSNALQRNFIGVTVAGDAKLANLDVGVQLDVGSDANTVSGNVISGNGAQGVMVQGLTNILTGNFIGTDTTGQLDLGNTNEGIRVDDGSSLDSIAANVIAYNQNGIILDVSTTDSNRLHLNLIYRNGFSGITIVGLSQQNVAPPRITGIAQDSTVSGTAAPNAFIQIYADSMDMNNQGRFFLGTTNADGSGFWSRKVALPSGTEIKALQDSALNTSAFSTPVIPFLGSLTVIPSSLLDFGTVAIGDSTVLTVNIFPVSGNVRVDSVTDEPGLPFRLLSNIDPPYDLFENSDTLFATFSFVPSAEGTFTDTVYFYSAFDTLEVIFTGVGSLNIGTLVTTVPSIDFDSVVVGDSASVTVQLFSNTGPVIVDQILTFIPDFHVEVGPLPDTLAAGADTLTFTVRFVPESAGDRIDTLRILSNSAAGTLSIPLSGTGLAGAGTLASGVVSVDFGNVRLGDSASAIVALFTGTGPVIVDQTQIGTSNFRVVPASFPDTLAAGTDTLELTVRFVPQAVGLSSDTLRVLSNSLGGTLSIPLVGTALENVPPVLDIYVVRSTVLKKYVEIVVTGNEGLSSVNGTLTLGTPTNVSLSSVGGSSRVFGVPFSLSTGTLDIAVTGTDSAGNSTAQNRSYAVGALERKSLTLRHGNAELSVAGKAFDVGTYLLLGSKAAEKTTSSLSKASAGWIEIGGRIDVMATGDLRSGERLTLRVSYDDAQLAEARRQADFDERRIGLYQLQDGQWQYLSGEGANGSVQGYVHKLGEIATFYNPDHVFLPKSVELSQNYPNPFNPSTTIRFGLPEEGRIRLTVYNMLGQRVAELFNGFARAGYHTITWQGLNEAGHRAASGVYIYRLETPNGLATRKMLLIK